jgi:transcriptional regulator GlxA family with amidase domain
MMADANDVCVVQRITGQLPQHDECTFFSLAIPAHFFDPEIRLVYARCFRTRVTDDLRPAEVLRRLGHALTSKTASGIHCEELLSELLAAALPQHTPEERSCSVRIKKARDFIDAHWREPFSLEELARAVGLTKWHLTRSFAASLGVRPSEYARTVRARHALAELQMGVPLARVALLTGYADQAHMNRELRRIFGFTPGSYRNASAASARGGDGTAEAGNLR